jgi:uncharacterized small protein (DUF1192 family)
MEPRPPIGQDRFMTNLDEDSAVGPKKLLVPPVLDMLGVDELNAYIAALEAEILRVKQAIAAKRAHRDAAAAFFKTPGGA